MSDRPLPKVYQCLYCKVQCVDLFWLKSHEDKCQAREVKEAEWNDAIQRARRRLERAAE